jgi:hypothetical protein
MQLRPYAIANALVRCTLVFVPAIVGLPDLLDAGAWHPDDLPEGYPPYVLEGQCWTRPAGGDAEGCPRAVARVGLRTVDGMPRDLSVQTKRRDRLCTDAGRGWPDRDRTRAGTPTRAIRDNPRMAG